MTHLHDRAAALVDGRLDAAGVRRALGHLAGCRRCRDAVADQERLKARMAALAGPAPDADLVARLAALGAAGPARLPVVAPTRRSGSGARPGGRRTPVAPVRPRGSRTSGVRAARSRVAVAVAGALSVVGVVGAAGWELASAGGRPPGQRQVPASFGTGSAGTSSSGASSSVVGWTPPRSVVLQVPVGARPRGAAETLLRGALPAGR